MKFMRLKDTTATIDAQEYFIDNERKILGILRHMATQPILA